LLPAAEAAQAAGAPDLSPGRTGVGGRVARKGAAAPDRARAA
jgi:hypothetical protein